MKQDHHDCSCKQIRQYARPCQPGTALPVALSREKLPCLIRVRNGAGRVSVTMVTEKGRQVALYRVLPGETCMLTVSCLMSGEPTPAQGMAEGETSVPIGDSRQ